MLHKGHIKHPESKINADVREGDNKLPWQPVLVGLDTPHEVGGLRAEIVDKSTNGDFELGGHLSHDDDDEDENEDDNDGLQL